MNFDDLRRLSLRDVGNWPLLFALAGIAAGAYVQGRWFPPRREGED